MSAPMIDRAVANAQKALRTPDLEWAYDIVHRLALDVLDLANELAIARGCDCGGLHTSDCAVWRDKRHSIGRLVTENREILDRLADDEGPVYP